MDREKTCMNCGTSSCDHDDARRCASSSRGLWTLSDDAVSAKKENERADEITRLQDALTAMTEERDRLLVTPPEKREDLWCVISDLCDQLAAMTNERDEAQSQCRVYNLYVVQLKQQLREALAACEVKDAALLRGARMAEELKKPCGMDPESKQAIRNGEYMNVSYFLREALAIKPDATALHAWFKEQLGEPVMEFGQSPNGNYLEMKWQSMYEAKLGDKLYSSKGVEKL